MKLVEIMATALLILYNEHESGNDSLIPMSNFLGADGKVHLDKISLAIVELDTEYGMVESSNIPRQEVYAKIKAKGIIIMEKFEKDKNKIIEEFENKLENLRIQNVIDSNIAINSKEIKQEITNE